MPANDAATTIQQLLSSLSKGTESPGVLGVPLPFRFRVPFRDHQLPSLLRHHDARKRKEEASSSAEGCACSLVGSNVRRGHCQCRTCFCSPGACRAFRTCRRVALGREPSMDYAPSSIFAEMRDAYGGGSSSITRPSEVRGPNGEDWTNDDSAPSLFPRELYE